MNNKLSLIFPIILFVRRREADMRNDFIIVLDVVWGKVEDNLEVEGKEVGAPFL